MDLQQLFTHKNSKVRDLVKLIYETDPTIQLRYFNLGIKSHHIYIKFVTFFERKNDAQYWISFQYTANNWGEIEDDMRFHSQLKYSSPEQGNTVYEIPSNFPWFYGGIFYEKGWVVQVNKVNPENEKFLEGKILLRITFQEVKKFFNNFIRSKKPPRNFFIK